MTGPEHYLEAERQLKKANQPHNVDTENEDRLVAQAQVHATLALAAATAGLDAVEGPAGGSATGRTAKDANAWYDAIGGAS